MDLKSFFGGSVILTAVIAATGFPCMGDDHNATIEMKSAGGRALGKLKATETADGVRIQGTLKDVSAGTHGIHVHATGRCDAPDFKSAGDHFNPDTKKHGDQNPQGPHVGDLTNITVGPDGKAVVDLMAKSATLKPGPNSLLRDGGTALVLHEGEDDRKTDPSGNSGARIACGVVKR